MLVDNIAFEPVRIAYDALLSLLAQPEKEVLVIERICVLNL